MTASVSSPSAGFLGFQLQGKIPSQLTSRLYGHYAVSNFFKLSTVYLIMHFFLFINCGFLFQSAPENDIDILNVNVAANGDEQIHFQAEYNLEAPEVMFLGLKKRLPLIASAITNFAEKYGILGAINGLKTALVSALTEAYTISHNHAADLSQLSVLFRNVVVQYQKAIQQLLNAAITFLRETQIKLPGMKEATLPEICQQIKISIAALFEDVVNAITDNLKAHVLPTLKTIRIVLPNDEILTGDEIIAYIENALTHCVNMLKQLENIDVILEKMGQALQEVVEKSQAFTDMIRSDYLEKVTAKINTLYTYNIRFISSLIEKVNRFLNSDNLNVFVDKCMELILHTVKEFKNIVYTVFPSDQKFLVHIHNRRLKMDITFPFYQ